MMTRLLLGLFRSILWFFSCGFVSGSALTWEPNLFSFCLTGNQSRAVDVLLLGLVIIFSSILSIVLVSNIYLVCLDFLLLATSLLECAAGMLLE